MDINFFDHVPNLIRYLKLNLDHYTCTRQNEDIPPLQSQFYYLFEFQKSKFS
jgi:hypothetical protein